MEVDEDGWEDEKPEPIDPKIPPTLKQLGGFPYGIRQTIKENRNSLVSFAVWMGTAELTVMLPGLFIFLRHPQGFASDGIVGPLWIASIYGAVFGFIPAIIVASIVSRRGKRPPLWALGGLSILFTMTLAFLMMIRALSHA